MRRWGRRGCLAQRKYPCFPPSSPGFESWLCWDFLSLLLSLWTELRSKQSGAKQWISQMQFAVMSRAKYYKNVLLCLFLSECPGAKQFYTWQIKTFGCSGNQTHSLEAKNIIGGIQTHDVDLTFPLASMNKNGVLSGTRSVAPGIEPKTFRA